jgi:hypothetical protein
MVMADLRMNRNNGGPVYLIQKSLYYRDRQMLFGEVVALQWVLSKYGQQ